MGSVEGNVLGKPARAAADLRDAHAKTCRVVLTSVDRLMQRQTRIEAEADSGCDPPMA
jgi:hypothetical protein